MSHAPISKFRGAMIGGLVGDCLGATFEFSIYTPQNKELVEARFDDLENPQSRADALLRYTSNTATLKNIARTLIIRHPVNYNTMAHLFADDYFLDKNRGYGRHEREIYRIVKNGKYTDVFEPATKQFGGSGSYGNGGAVRITPVALYYDKFDEMINVARKATSITHAHSLGITGALLQCIAIREAVHWQGEFHPQRYVATLIDKLNQVERNAQQFVHKLEKVKGYLKRNSNAQKAVSDEDVIKHLGNDVTALGSVPTGIYCFAQAHNGFVGIHSNNVFRRAIQYAISLGGDADNIAPMVGAIAGGYFGDGVINQNLIKRCEFKAEMFQLANELHISSAKKRRKCCALM